MRRLRGAPASSGVARGALVSIVRERPPVGGRIEPSGAEREIARLTVAVSAAAEALEALASEVAAGGHAEEGGIFSAQAAMARDPALAALAEERIRAGQDAIGAIQGAGADVADQLRGLGDELLSARAADVDDVAGRIAGLLAGRSGRGPTLDEPAIVVAQDLPPSLTAGLPRDRLLGFALEAGSATSHAAILARAYGIPAVVGVAGLLATVEEAARESPAGRLAIIVDGDTGEVVIDPDNATARRLAGRMAEAARASERALAEADLPVVTLDGTRVDLLANIGTPDEADRAIALGARGVGLFRTEFLFIERSAPPSEDEQAAAYRAVVEAFAPHPVTIRLLDVGGDKPIPYLKIPAEANPFLGVRALRLAPERPELFITQLRAAMRAAVAHADRPIGTVKVMAPMIADATDADLLISLAEQAQASLERDGIPPRKCRARSDARNPLRRAGRRHVLRSARVRQLGHERSAAVHTCRRPRQSRAGPLPGLAASGPASPRGRGGGEDHPIAHRALGLRRDGRRSGRLPRAGRAWHPPLEHGRI